MKNKRLLVLAALLSVTALTACANNQGSSSAASSVTSSEAASSEVVSSSEEASSVEESSVEASSETSSVEASSEAVSSSEEVSSVEASSEAVSSSEEASSVVSSEEVSSSEESSEAAITNAVGSVDAPATVEAAVDECLTMEVSVGKTTYISTVDSVIDGLVKSITKSTKNANSYLAVLVDSFDATKELTVYYGTVAENGDVPVVGDSVRVTGKMENYNGTAELTDATYGVVAHHTYAVSVTAENATVTGLDETGVSGSTATFTVAAADGYQVSAVKVNNVEVTAAEDGSYSFVVTNVNTVEVTTASADTKLASVIYSTGFESSEGFTTASVYNNTTATNYGGEDNTWAITMGCITSTGCLDGAQSLQMRAYSGTSTYGVAECKTLMTNATEVTVNANYSTTECTLALYTSTDGTTWAKTGDSQTLTTTATAYTYVISSEENGASVYLKFVVEYASAPAKTSRTTIDSVSVKGYAA